MRKVTSIIFCFIMLISICSGCAKSEVTPNSASPDPLDTQVVSSSNDQTDAVEIAVFYQSCDDRYLDTGMQALFGAVNKATEMGANVSVFTESIAGNTDFVDDLNSWLKKNKSAKKGLIAIDSDGLLKFIYDDFKKEGVSIGLIYTCSHQIEPQPSEMYYDYLKGNGFSVDFKCYYDIFDMTEDETDFLKEKYGGKSGSIIASIHDGLEYNILGKQNYRIEIWRSAMKEKFGPNAGRLDEVPPLVCTREHAEEEIDSYFPPNNNVLAFIAKNEVLIEATKENKNVTGDIYFEGVCNDEVLAFIDDGAIAALFEIPCYDMGEKSVDAIIDVIDGKSTDYLIKSDMNILTKENFEERKEQIDKAKKILEELNF